MQRGDVHPGDPERASLIGATVKVWTSNDLVSTYRVTAVRRHVTSLDGVFDIGAEQLWIQTSEGPRGTIGKLIVVAKRVGYEAAEHEEAQPTPYRLSVRDGRGEPGKIYLRASVTRSR